MESGSKKCNQGKPPMVKPQVLVKMVDTLLGQNILILELWSLIRMSLG
jgi:hypothetical protein